MFFSLFISGTGFVLFHQAILFFFFLFTLTKRLELAHVDALLNVK